MSETVQDLSGNRYAWTVISNFPAAFRRVTAPAAWFYRRLKETLDLTFLYEPTKDCYGSTGNPSIDPVVFRSGGPVQIHAHRLSGEYYL